MTAAEACTTLATHGIDFVNEQNTGGVLLTGFKQVAHAASTHAHEHFHKVRTRHAKERHTCFACNSAGEQSLTGTRRANQQGALRNAAAQGIKLFRVLQEFNEFLQVLLGFVAASYIVKGGLLFAVKLASLALAKAEGALAAATHLAVHHQVEEYNQENCRQECDNGVDPGAGFVNDFDLDALVHFPGGNLVVADFQHVATERLCVSVVVRPCKAGEGALVLFRFGLFFGAHFTLAFDNHAIGGLLQGKFGNHLGGVTHHG